MQTDLNFFSSAFHHRKTLFLTKLFLNETLLNNLPVDVLVKKQASKNLKQVFKRFAEIAIGK